MSLFNMEWLHKLSIPFVFSTVLIAIPAALTGLLVSVVRPLLFFSHHRVHMILWVLLTVLVGVTVSMKFMSWISRELIEIAGVMGGVSALIACVLISLIERKRGYWYRKLC